MASINPDRLVLLLNEIDIVLAQMRLFELCIKQAQARARYQTTRAHQEYQAELTSIRRALADGERAHAATQAAAGLTEQNLLQRVQALQTELDEKQLRLDQRDAEMKSEQARAASLHARIDELESRNWAAELEISRNEIQTNAERELAQARSDFTTELTRLQAALAERDQALAQAKSMIAQFETSLNIELVTLRSQLEQKQELIEFRDEELGEAVRRVTALEQRANDLESANQLAANNAYALELTGRAYAQEIDSLRQEIAVKERTLSERQEAVTAVELALYEKIESLQQELARGRQQIDERNNELKRLRGEIAGLCESIEQQNSVAAGALAARRQAEKMHSAVEAENRRLAICLAEKEQALASLQEKLSGEIGQLQSRLNEQRVVADLANGEIERLRASLAVIETEKNEREQSRREFEATWRQAAALNQDLETRVNAAEALHSQSAAKIRELQLQLAESQLIANTRAAEINDLNAQAARLSLQLAERDAANSELQKRFQTAIESDRNRFQSEMAAVRDDSEIQQQALNHELSRERERASRLTQQLSESEQRVIALTNEIDEREKELHALTVESANLRSRFEQLQTLQRSERAVAEREKSQAQLKFDADLAAVREKLQEKSSLSAHQQAALENLAHAHQSQIQNLEAKVTELQNQIADRNLDLGKSQSQVRLLEARIESSKERQEAQCITLDRATKIKEEYGGRIAELERLLAHKDSELQRSRMSQSQLEQTLRQEIDRLVHEAQEKNQILQNRNDELVRVKAAMDPLQERLTEMERTTTGMATAAAAESERMRAEFQAQLALLQAELSQKDWALEEREAMTQTLEQNYRQEIGSLRQQLDEHASRETRADVEFIIGEAKPTRGREARITTSETASGNGGEPYRSGQQRRWHTGFGWKRRWKSSET